MWEPLKLKLKMCSLYLRKTCPHIFQAWFLPCPIYFSLHLRLLLAITLQSLSLSIETGSHKLLLTTCCAHSGYGKHNLYNNPVSTYTMILLLARDKEQRKNGLQTRAQNCMKFHLFRSSEVLLSFASRSFQLLFTAQKTRIPLFELYHNRFSMQ